MDKNLTSMGDTGTTNFNNEVTNTEQVAVNETVDPVSANTNVEGQTKTVEDVIKESEEAKAKQEEQAIVAEREKNLISKTEEFFGRKQDATGDQVTNEEPAEANKEVVSENDTKQSQESEQSIKEAKQAIEAAKRVKQTFEEKSREILKESKELKTDLLELNIENKSLKAKIEEMANDRASKSNNLIDTDDMRVRYYANLNGRITKDPDNSDLKAKKVEYLVDELSIQTPHITPEQLRTFLVKQEEKIDVMPSGKTDYMAEAKAVADTVASDKKKSNLLSAIGNRKINYDKF